MLGLALLGTACGPAVSSTGTDGEGSSGTGGSDGSTTVVVPDPSSTASSSGPIGPSTTVEGTTATTEDTESPETTGGVSANCLTDNCMIDVIVVVDNSSAMAGAQRTLALSMILLDEQLRELGADVQVMFTTTDMDNPFCAPFSPEGYTPAMGSPVTTACTDRLQDFVGLGTDPLDEAEACTSVCPEPLAPNLDLFVAFNPAVHNLPQEGSVDLDGDGELETATAQALACMAPMGINGCGFESPLEAMLQAVNPEATWNLGPRPFVREGAALGVVLLSNELDCSVRTPSMMSNPDFYETNPDTGNPALSSAVCWNAGIDCVDQGGEIYDCQPNNADNLQPIDRYSAYLESLWQTQDKPVFMLGLLGVPAVTAHNSDPPFQPTEGGQYALVVRDWTEEDLLPQDVDAGVTAADQQFNYGVAPGCSRPQSTSVAQALPPLRTLELCSRLSDQVDQIGNSVATCCVESICDDDYTSGMRCLASMLEDNVMTLPPKG